MSEYFEVSNLSSLFSFSFIFLLFIFYFLQKINQKNTWELNLIDHLTDIIKAEEEEDVETNFQKGMLCQ